MKNIKRINSFPFDFQIISFMGYKGVGKDTLANNVAFKLQQFSDVNIVRMNLADTMKAMICLILKIECDDLEYLKRKENLKIINGMSMREFLISYSETLKNVFGKDLWVRNVIDKFFNEYFVKNKKNILIIADLRYLEEYKFLSKYNYKNIYLEIENYIPKNLDSAERNYDKIPYDLKIKVKKQTDFDNYVDKLVDFILKEN